MANSILDAIWANRPTWGISGHVLSTALFLADKASNEYRETWYTQNEMARSIGASKSTVYRATETLRAVFGLQVRDCNGIACKGRYHQRTPHYYIPPLPGEAVARPKRETGRRPRGRPRKLPLPVQKMEELADVSNQQRPAIETEPARELETAIP